MATSIKRVKPAYVQTLRPETANVSEDDIRLSYAQLFFNTFNGFEKEDLGEKLRAYCVDDCSMSVKWIGERGKYNQSIKFRGKLCTVVVDSLLIVFSLCAGNPCGPNYREVKGVYPVTTFLEAIMVTAVPDAVAQLQDSKLRVKPDRSSYLLCKYTFNGTQITKIDPAKSSAGPALDIRSMMGKAASTTSAGSSSTSAGSSAQNNGSSDSSGTNTNIGGHASNTNSDAHSNTNGTSNSAVVPGSKRLRTGADSKTNLNSDTSSVSSGGKPAASKVRGKRSADGQEEAPIIETVPMAATELLPVSMKMSIVGTLIIHINSDKRIYKFEYIQKVIRLN